MTIGEQYLNVRESQLPGAGNGLYTEAPVKKGTYIIEYTGRRTSWEEVEEDHTNAYIVHLDEERVIDGREHLDALARYANDAMGLVRVKGLRNNARFIVDDDKVYLEATRDIAAGSEIFASYGKAYWQTVLDNRQHEESIPCELCA